MDAEIEGRKSMSKVVVITGSPRKGGNSDLLAEAFIDAAKAQYETYLELILPYLHCGSVVVFDNVLAQDSGSTLDSRYAIERRDRTIHARMREFLHSVASDERFASDLSNAGDGILTITLL